MLILLSFVSLPVLCLHLCGEACEILSFLNRCRCGIHCQRVETRLFNHPPCFLLRYLSLERSLVLLKLSISESDTVVSEGIKKGKRGVVESGEDFSLSLDELGI